MPLQYFVHLMFHSIRRLVAIIDAFWFLSRRQWNHSIIFDMHFRALQLDFIDGIHRIDAICAKYSVGITTALVYVYD